MMLKKTIVLVVVVTSAIAVYLGADQLWAQDTKSPTNRIDVRVAPQANRTTRRRSSTYNSPNARYSYYGATKSGTAGSAEEAKMGQRTAVVLKQYREASDDEKRTVARDALTKVLDEHFELRVQQREKQVEELQARVAKLAAQLEQRRKAKAQIIDLRLKVLINEADGLGF